MPDVEQVAIELLADVLDDSVTVGSEWPENLAQNLPVVAVSLGPSSGSAIKAVTANRGLDIDVLAPTKGEARDLAALVSAHLLAAQGTRRSGARIYGVEETSLIWLPDPVTNIPRYVLVMSMVVRPA
ncbi:hypothetical protein [Streptomyces sp. TRM75561]|uniref:hypothetical protein n=1 Tax=Streptomyces sp. TRM75561 TaxID=2975269 RepID=UPI0024478F13|nr:hypothetical protein [Streptomyces sp. TRM75561]MDH3037926.1 hypothetical protein [Streptomyces sp. TRM75561]